MFSNIKPVVSVTELTVVKGATVQSGRGNVEKTTHEFDHLKQMSDGSKWAGLTDEEVINLAKSAGVYGTDYLEELMEFSASIESKLRSKNDNSR